MRSPNQNGRRAIWASLKNMQGDFCAFCESIAEKGDGHIEHFFHKGTKANGTAPYKHLTFDWNNLFGCCGTSTSDTCGHFKDRQGIYGPGNYNPNHLIKPDIDDPSYFFIFLATGKIKIKSGLSGQDENRAKETIRVLNLEALNGVRKREIDRSKKEIDSLYGIAGIGEQELIQQIDLIKQAIKKQPHQTAVMDALFSS